MTHNPYNGIRIKKHGNTIFIPLPKNGQFPIAGGCDCNFCKLHPDKVPCWDTLAVAGNSDRSWTIHYPELQGSE